MCNYNICNTTRNLIKSLCLLLLVGCGDLPDEGTLRRQGTSVTINYNHSDALKDIELTRYSSSVRSMVENTWPVRHNIKVEPNIADIDLDDDLRAEVEVPIDEPMYVEYANWTQEEPEIPFMYGKSNEFIVTWEDDYIVKVWVDVELNPDYPYQEEWEDEYDFDEEDWEDLTDTDNETTDNETVTDNETEVIDTSLLVHLKFEETHATVSGQSIVKDHSSYERVFKKCTNAYGSGNAMYDASVSTLTDAPSGQTGNFLGSSCIETEFRDNSTSPIGLSDDWTISFWILPKLSNQSFDQWHSVMSTGTNSTSGGRFQIDHDGYEKLRFNETVGGGIMKVDMEEEWMFFTYTKTTDTSTGDNQKIRVYKDGVLKTYAYPISTLWDKLKIGMNRNGGGGWIGYIDDFRVYNRSLTADEVEKLYEDYGY